jgi:uncharacterized protein involved in exopolysaccharide biosynthesis
MFKESKCTTGIYYKKYLLMKNTVLTKTFLITLLFISMMSYSQEIVRKGEHQLHTELYKSKIDIESELAIQNKYLNDSSMQAKIIADKLAFIESKIADIEKSNETNTMAFDNIPNLMYQYAKLEFRVKIYMKAYEYLFPQLESARIDEIEDTDSIEIVDIAKPSGLRSEPKRAKTCIILFIAAFLFSSLLALVIDSISETQKGKIRLIFKNLLSFK